MKRKQRLIFEFLSIVIAVVLAMGLTEWRQNTLNRLQAQSSFQKILEEIGDNHSQLLEDSTKMAENLEGMKLWISVDRNFRDTLDLTINFDLSFLNSSAWEVAKFNQSLTFLDHEKVQKLAQVYLVQEFFERAGEKVFSKMSGLVSVIDESTLDYEEKMRGFRFEMSLAFSAAIAYLNTSKQLLQDYSASSDLVVQ